MTGFEKLQIAMLFLAGIGGVLSPIIATLMTMQHRSRSSRFNDLTARLGHIDECLDHLKMIVVGSAVTRTDLDARMLALRSDIAGDTHGLHERLMRLENRALGGNQ